jgi:hypothetical protein
MVQSNLFANCESESFTPTGPKIEYQRWRSSVPDYWATRKVKYMIEIAIIVLFSTLTMNGIAKPRPPRRKLKPTLGFMKKSNGIKLTATVNNATIVAIEGYCPHRHPLNRKMSKNIDWFGMKYAVWRNHCVSCNVEYHLVREK